MKPSTTTKITRSTTAVTFRTRLVVSLTFGASINGSNVTWRTLGAHGACRLVQK